MGATIKKTANRLCSFSVYFLGGIFILITSLFFKVLWNGNQVSIASFEKEIKGTFISTVEAQCWTPPAGDGGDGDGGGGDGCDSNNDGSCSDGSY